MHALPSLSGLWSVPPYGSHKKSHDRDSDDDSESLMMSSNGGAWPCSGFMRAERERTRVDLDANRLSGQPEGRALGYQGSHHAGPMRVAHQPQRWQTLLEQLAGNRHAEHHGRHTASRCAPRHGLGRQQGVDLVYDAVSRQRTHGSCRHAHRGPGLSTDPFCMPALVRAHRQFFGRKPERIQQGRHQSRRLFACSWNARIRERRADDAHQHLHSRVMFLIFGERCQGTSINQRRHRFAVAGACRSSQHLASLFAQGIHRPAGMRATLSEDHLVFPLPPFAGRNSVRHRTSQGPHIPRTGSGVRVGTDVASPGHRCWSDTSRECSRDVSGPDSTVPSNAIHRISRQNAPDVSSVARSPASR
jgi:hypothetical protein